MSDRTETETETPESSAIEPTDTPPSETTITGVPEPAAAEAPEAGTTTSASDGPTAAQSEAEAASAEPSPGEPAESDSGDASRGEDKPPPKPAKRRPRDPAVLRAFRAGLPVEGKVEKVIKGGYEVRVGRLRGFCPQSQMDVQRVENPEEHVGKVYAWRILQLRRGGEDVVVSRRALLEEERGEEAKAVRATLVEGAITSGHVARLTDFGAFVDLGAGVTGLVHLTELSHARVTKASDAVRKGDFIQVRILKVDEATGKISLSLKQTQEDPWAGLTDTLREGDRVPGTVTRVADFGAFVELRPKLEALAPAREFPPSPGGWREGLEPGTMHEWIVLSVEPSRRRISVLPATVEGAVVDPSAVTVGAHISGRVQKCESFGVFVWLGPGRVGLMPKVWTGVPYGQSFESKYPVGETVAVEVVEISDDGKRIRLAAEGVARRDPARQESRRPPRGRAGRDNGRDHSSDSVEAADRTSEGPPSPFGTHLGDALKAALGKRSEI